MVDHGLDPRNKFKLIQNSRGNAAEWGNEDGVSFGGGWPHNVEFTLNNDMLMAEGTNAWTGFRNVCEWKKWED